MTQTPTRSLRHLALWISALALALALLAPMTFQASAQDVAPPTPDPEGEAEPGDGAIWNELEGVDQAILRLYSHPQDVEPDADPEEVDEAEPQRIIAILVSFESPESASDALDAVTHWATESLQVQDMSSEVIERDASDLPQVEEHELDPEQVRAYTMSSEGEDEVSEITVVGVQTESTIAISAVTAGSEQDIEEANGDAVELVASIVAESPSDEPVTQSEEGQFAGGEWERLPDEGDDVLRGLMFNSDLQLYPEAAATPEA